MTAHRTRRWAMAAALVLVAAANQRFLRPWQQHWGATGDEVTGRLPGDDLVAEPAIQTTRAITVAAAPHDVWPWVIQLGADRGGFYSYDWLENLFGLHVHSANRVVDEWQERSLGDLVYADANGRGWWYVMVVRPDDALVLKVGDPALGRPVERHEGIGWEFLWTFAVREGAGGTTRLLVRERVGFGSRLAKTLMAPVGVVSFVMTRKMLLGIKSRVETTA